MLRITLCWALEDVFLGSYELGPPVVERILIPDRLVGVNLSLLPFILLGRRLGGVFGIFGIIRSVVVSGAGVPFLFVMRFGAAPLTLTF